MENKSLTAVEWLDEELWKVRLLLRSGDISQKFYFTEEQRLIDQAKQMEKEQIVNAFQFGVSEGFLTDINYMNCDEDAEYYYNETYKK